jgi:hypothetical protein
MLLEGTDIRALLQQVRDDYGPDARIVHAERIRTGGVGGFFAKQRFEVAVEVDGDSPAAFLPGGSAATATPVVPAQAAAPSAPASLGAPLSFEDAVAAVNAEARPAAVQVAPAAPRDAIDLVLASMSAADQAPASVSPSLSPAHLQPLPLAPVQPLPVVAAPVVAAPVPYAAAPAGPVEASLLAGQPRLIDSELPIERAARAAADHGLTPVGPAATAAHQTQASALPPAAVLSPPVTLSPAMAASAAAARLIQAAAASVDLASAQAGPAVNPVLASAPVPAAAPAPAAEQLAPVVALAVVPEPGPEPILVPARPGDVLVLVGDPATAYTAAVRLAATCRIPASAVSVLTARESVAGVPDDRLLHDLLEVRLRGAELAHARTAGIVVVDAPFDLVADPQGRAWVADAVQVVGAAATWALVDATRRAEDLQRWLGCLPSPQALVVHGAALTSDPDAVLGLGLPVASHDGLPTDRAADAPLTVRRTS